MGLIPCKVWSVSKVQRVRCDLARLAGRCGCGGGYTRLWWGRGYCGQWFDLCRWCCDRASQDERQQKQKYFFICHDVLKSFWCFSVPPSRWRLDSQKCESFLFMRAYVILSCVPSSQAVLKVRAAHTSKHLAYCHRSIGQRLSRLPLFCCPCSHLLSGGFMPR